MKPQLQPGHWYLVHDGDGHASIRAYMDGGWYPRDPWPQQAVCEMGRTEHPDNIDVPDDVQASELDRAVIEAHYPAASTYPAIANGIYGMAMAMCLANEKEWDWELPDANPQDRINYLIIACSVLKSTVGSNGVVRDWSDVLATSGSPLAIFRPRKWPTEVIAGALQLSDAA
jgi:hypothetical protein